MLYLFATVFHDLSRGDERGMADLQRGRLDCALSLAVRQCGQHCLKTGDRILGYFSIHRASQFGPVRMTKMILYCYHVI
jgi:hypothetical protein